jgi:hypothetical protein
MARKLGTEFVFNSALYLMIELQNVSLISDFAFRFFAAYVQRQLIFFRHYMFRPNWQKTKKEY